MLTNGQGGMSQVVARHNPWRLLTSDEALEDSPFFRSSLHQVEDEIEGAGRWLEAFVRNLRTALELSLSTEE